MLSPSQRISGSLLQPYLFLALLLLGVALITACLPLPDLLSRARHEEGPGKDSAWRYAHTVAGAVAAFFYVGTEVLLGSFIIDFLRDQQPDMPDKTMPLFVSLYWGGLLVGRGLGPWVIRFWQAERVLMVSALAATGLVLTGISSSGILAVLAITLVGLCNSVMFPVIYSLAMKGLSPMVATQASGIISTAIAGGAVLPFLGGFMADRSGITAAFWLSVFSYLVIFGYSIVSAKTR